MAISIRYGLQQTQRLSLSQTQIQGLELLQLSNMELYERITQELQENPVIEDGLEAHETAAPEASPPLGEEDRMVNLEEDSPPEEMAEPVDEEPSLPDRDSDGGHAKNYLELAVAERETLIDHLTLQAKLSLPASLLPACEAVITSLDDRGFLAKNKEDLAADLKLEPEILEEAIAAVRLLDPVGCAVYSVAESIGVQARYFFPEDILLHRVIDEHFLDLEQLNHDKIAQALHVPIKTVIEKGQIIHDLDPFPGRRFSPGAIDYVLPDVEVKIISGEIVIILNDEWIPKIHINPYYLSYLKKKNIEKNIKEYIQGKVKSARNLVRNISGRRITILKVVSSIMAHQREFLDKGPGHLKPLTHGDVAKDVELHESTVSRVTANKFAQTSWGIFDLKYFFVTKLKSSGMEASADWAMKRLSEIFNGENAERPYSDEEVAAMLVSEGINVARRTVAKYRELLSIPSSSRRKKINRIKTEGKV